MPWPAAGCGQCPGPPLPARQELAAPAHAAGPPPGLPRKRGRRKSAAAASGEEEECAAASGEERTSAAAASGGEEARRPFSPLPAEQEGPPLYPPSRLREGSGEGLPARAGLCRACARRQGAFQIAGLHGSGRTGRHRTPNGAPLVRARRPPAPGRRRGAIGLRTGSRRRRGRRGRNSSAGSCRRENPDSPLSDRGGHYRLPASPSHRPSRPA